MTLFYIPLEPYESRYTMQWSAPKTGWLEKNWIDHKVDYIRIEGKPNSGEIKTGSVLDGHDRTLWAFEQTCVIIQKIISETIKESDVIFFDDFFHPGLEMIAYNAALKNIHLSMYSFCHAQSVDKYDFTHQMITWMRPLEKSFAQIYDGVFVNNETLRKLCIKEWDCPRIYNCGHVFDSKEVLSRMEEPRKGYNGEVIFSSRFDEEKQPHLFMDFVEFYFSKIGSEDSSWPTFRICTGMPKLVSTNPSAVERARKLTSIYPKHFIISEGLSKQEYYNYLRQASVQISTSLQDWISFTLLEAVTAGAYPLYPNFRSFPEAFGEYKMDLYEPWDLNDMYKKLDRILKQDRSWKELFSELMYETIVKPHDETWKRQLDVMKVQNAP